MRTDDLDFYLPPELIAQTPASDRAASRLLHYRRTDQTIAHRTFADLPTMLRNGDLLVFNDARVVPARFSLKKPSGGRIEALFLKEISPRRWSVLLRGMGRFHGQLEFSDLPGVTATPIRAGEGGEFEIEVSSDEPALVVLSRIGRMPLPPYIKRDKDYDQRDAADRERYQTVYARQPGAVAAPTAGLHFTDQLMGQLDDVGVEKTFVTLHVGIGTFKPVTAETLEDHVMHSEAYSISAEAAAALNRANEQARRIIAVGTTSARVLESQPADQPFASKTDQTSIFIYPPYAWRHIGAMITNFHLPRSTLIAMIAAMVGLNEQRRIYQTAIERRYRFFSYGDAMLIE